FSIYLNRFTAKRRSMFRKFRFLKNFRSPADAGWEPHKWEIGYRGYSVEKFRDTLERAGWQPVRQEFTEGCRSILLVGRNTGKAASTASGSGLAALPDGCFRHHVVDPPLVQGTQAFRRRVDDRFLMHVEAGVDQHRHAGQLGIGRENVVVQRVLLTADHLGARRPVDMHHGGNALAPLVMHLAGDGHEPGGVKRLRRQVEDPGRIDIAYHRRERHEIGAVQPLVQDLVDLGFDRRSHDGASAKRAWPVFHALRIDRHHLAGVYQGSRILYRIAADQPAAAAGNDRVDVG